MERVKGGVLSVEGGAGESGEEGVAVVGGVGDRGHEGAIVEAEKGEGEDEDEEEGGEELVVVHNLGGGRHDSLANSRRSQSQRR